MAITYAAYPEAGDVTALMEGVGLIVPTGFDVDAYVQAAIDEWEESTGYIPFLARVLAQDEDPPSFYYDPPGPNLTNESRGGGRRLVPDRGFVTVTEIRTGVSVDDAVGTLLVQNVDYRLKPYNAAYDLKPYTEIEFVAYRFGEPRSIKLTGNPGYCSALKAEVWKAIRSLAASEFARDILEASSQNPVEWKRGEAGEKFDADRLERFGLKWRDSALAVMMRYVRYA